MGRDNTLYVANRQRNLVHVWFEGSVVPDRNISGGLSAPLSVLAATNGDIYVDNGVTYFRVDRWSSNSTLGAPYMDIPEECYSLFLDIANSLYCAATYAHRIVKKWSNDNVTTSSIVAGTGGAGAAANLLSYPMGVFVDLSFNIYVGDCGNNRVQMFAFGQPNAVSIVGSGAPGTFTLYCPGAITLDANGYLFIVDVYNHRLIGSGPLGYRCLFGCTGVAGSTASQFYYPRTFSFDRDGNIFVTDQINYRIQKFLLASNSCSRCRALWTLLTKSCFCYSRSLLQPAQTLSRCNVVFQRNDPSDAHNDWFFT